MIRASPASRVLSILFVIVLCIAVSGCEALNPRPPIEAFAGKFADEVIIPAVREGLAQGVEQLSVQAGAQTIDPAYVVLFEGKWVVGIEGRASVGVEGLAAQAQITSTASGENESPTHGEDELPTRDEEDVAAADAAPG